MAGHGDEHILQRGGAKADGAHLALDAAEQDGDEVATPLDVEFDGVVLEARLDLERLAHLAREGLVIGPGDGDDVAAEAGPSAARAYRGR